LNYFNRFRLSKRVVNVIFALIVDKIQSLTNRYAKVKRNKKLNTKENLFRQILQKLFLNFRNHAITPEQMMSLTLRFLASGNILTTVGDFIGIHKSTAGKCVWKVLKAIAMLRSKFLTFPNDVEGLNNFIFNINGFFLYYLVFTTDQTR